MALILCIETSSSNCSVALYDDVNLLSIYETSEANLHSSHLHPFISGVLTDAGKKPKDLEGLLLGSGPGSFTGLRIGASAAKGFCFSLSIPFMAVSSLQIMAKLAQEHILEQKWDQNKILCPLIDARRMEVYTATYDTELNELDKPKAIEVTASSFSELIESGPVCFAGNGATKVKGLLGERQNLYYLEDIFPSALGMGGFARSKFLNSDFEDITYFEPLYIKNFQPTKSGAKN